MSKPTTARDHRRRDRRRRASKRRPFRTRHGLNLQTFEGPPLGPGLVTADPATVLAALDDFDPEAAWEVASRALIPLLPRLRPFPVPLEGLVRVMLPPGVLTGFGLDLGPAVTFLERSRLEHWGVDVATVVSTALANVRRLAASCSPDAVVHDAIEGAPLAAFQSGHGIASTLLLVPEVIEPLLGRGPHLLLAPMRDLLLALPASVDRDFAVWLSAEWEALDPNCLRLGAFLHEAGVITPLALDEPIGQA